MWDELEIERAKAQADLEKAEAGLAKAEADFDKAAIDQANAKADADSAHSIAALDKARARCYQARVYWRRAQLRHDQLYVALAELSRAQMSDRARQKTDDLIEAGEAGRELHVVAGRSDRSASKPSAQSGEHPVRNQKQMKIIDMQARKPTASSALFHRKLPAANLSSARKWLTRAILLLLALLFAYFQYYFFDGKHQIALLPQVMVYA